MKNNLRTVLSVVLSLVMLLSITLSAVPTAVAEDTVPAAAEGEKVIAAVGSGLAGMAKSGWKHYYTEFSYYHYVSPATEMPSDDAFWYLVNNGGTVTLSRRMDKANSTKTYKPWGNISQIVYTEKTFKNFEINATVYYSQHSRGNDTPLYIGFGKKDLGLSMFNYQGGFKGGMGIAIGDGGNVALVARYNGTHGNTTENKLVYTTTQSIADNTPYNIRVVVLNGIATVYVEGALVASYTLPDDSTGYVSFGGSLANASGFASFDVTEIDTPDLSADISSGLAGMAEDGWTHYYTEYSYYHYISDAKAMPADNTFWYVVNEGGTKRLTRSMDVVNTYKTYKPWGNISQIVYTGKTFKNFEINATVYYSQHSRGNDTPLYIGFGKKDLGLSMFNYQGGFKGGMGIAIGDGGNVALVARYNGKHGDATSNLLNFTTTQSIPDNTFYDVNVKVLNGVATVKVNGTEVAQYTLPDSSEGYVSFGSALANISGFAKFELTKLDSEVNSAEGVTVDKTNVLKGETVKATVTAPEGKQLKAGSLKYTLDGETYYPITTRVGADESVSNVFSFAMPEGDVSIVAEFIDANAANHALLGAAYNIENGEAGKDMRFGSRAYRKAGDKDLVSCGNYLLRADGAFGSELEDGVELTEAQISELLNPTKGQTPTRVPTSVLNDRCDDYVDYTVRITGVADGYADVDYVCVSYANYRDAEGNVETVYSAPCIRSYNQLINAAQ